MTNSRYDRSRDSRWRPEAERGSRYERDEDRGFLERAGDQIASWFGDDEAERRRDMDERGYDRGQRRPAGRQPATYGSSYGPSSWGRDDDRYDRSRMVEDGYRRPYTGRVVERESRGGYRPMTGDYGRFGREEERSFTGTAPTAQDAPSGMPAHDRHYGEWRQRQIEELDRDYDEYRREHQSRFEGEFSSWRKGRQSKRELLGQVREHMDVVGSDDAPVGKVDHIRRDRIILTKSDSDDGRHHPVGCSMFDRIEGDKLFLNVPAEVAKAKLHEESRGRALGEREEQGSDGPHILDRSFSGTY